MRQRRWNWLGAFGIAVLFLAGCSESEGTATAGTDEVVVTDDAASDDGALETAATSGDPSAPISADSVYDPGAEPLLTWFSPFEPGAHRTGALGTPMSFTTTEPLSSQVNGGGMFVVTDIQSQGPDDSDLVFLRVGAFADPTEPNAPIEEQTGWPADDFGGWLENLHDGILATEPVQTSVNGFAATRVDLELGDIECGYGRGECVGFVTNHDWEVKALSKGSKYRVWIVEQAGEAPLAIVSAINNDEDSPWFDRADAVMATLAFGDIAPNPVRQLIAGPNQVDVLGGVEFSMPDDRLLIHQWKGRHYAFLQVDLPISVVFADTPHDLDGNPLASSEELVAELTAAGIDVTELDSITIDGVDSRVLDVTSATAGPIAFRYSALDLADPNILGWEAPAVGRLWLIDHPERGLMAISAKAFEDVDETMPIVVTLVQEIVDTLTFTG